MANGSIELLLADAEDLIYTRTRASGAAGAGVGAAHLVGGDAHAGVGFVVLAVAVRGIVRSGDRKTTVLDAEYRDDCRFDAVGDIGERLLKPDQCGTGGSTIFGGNFGWPFATILTLFLTFLMILGEGERGSEREGEQGSATGEQDPTVTEARTAS